MIQTIACWLAQLGPEGGEAGIAEAAEAAPQQGPSPFGLGFWLPMLLAMFLIMLMMRPRKDDSQLKKRLAELKKNDRVVTAGGIIGTVVAMREDSVSLRIDEATNAKLQILKSSIVRILADDKASSSES